MVVLRRTQKLARSLPIVDHSEASSETALGDWYVNRVVIRRHPLLLLISSRSHLPVVIPARNVADLPKNLPEIIRSRLERMDVPPRLVAAEAAAMTPVVVQRTNDRSVVGILNNFAQSLPYHLHQQELDATALRYAEDHLEKTPCYAGRRFEDVVFPDMKTLALLHDRWGIDRC